MKRIAFPKISKTIVYVILINLLIIYWLSLPRHLFNGPFSTIIEDKKGELLGARIADDGQWRFPMVDSVPEKYKKALIEFEDRYYYRHPGVNPLALGRALIQNLKNGKIVSGGSTLSMQVIRLSRKGKNRNLYQKLIEMILATRLEIRYTKEEILRLYASHAPFGGNVVGLDAAAWRYFGRSAPELSWGESCALAVLPNAPSLIHPGKNRIFLEKKRNLLLQRLHSRGVIDSLTYGLSLLEPLPDNPLPLPMKAPHLLDRAVKERKGKKIRTTLDGRLQDRVNQIAGLHHKQLAAQNIHNLAILVLEAETGNVAAYLGNIRNTKHPGHNGEVDIIVSHRSTGSLLKPLLFAAMLDDGELLPGMLVPDIPTHIAGYTPKNFSLGYDGAVPAKRALERSLNIPSVKMLQQYGYERFYHLLKKLGMQTLYFPPDHYGLSLILGGAEGSLWDMTGIYASLTRTLNHYKQSDGQYLKSDIHPPAYEFAPIPETSSRSYKETGLLSAASIWFTYQALNEINRPKEEASWEYFSSGGKIAWKTGTSFGFRDAWAIGTNSEYVVGVWTGNADGEGRPGLTGFNTSAPILFDIFGLLPQTPSFPVPYDEMIAVPLCKQSGHRAGMYCEPVDTTWIPNSGLKTPPCPYHWLVHLSPDEKFRVTSKCEDPDDMIHKAWFALPPVQEWYYKTKHPSYKILPPYKPQCGEESLPVMEWIYPRESLALYVPKELDGSLGNIIFEVAHRQPETIIYWHLDDNYVGQTKTFHQIGLQPEKGKHTITLVDEKGNIITRSINIIARNP